jgi:hypothetical protein
MGEWLNCGFGIAERACGWEYAMRIHPQLPRLLLVVPIRWDNNRHTGCVLTALTVHPLIAMPPPEALLHKHMVQQHSTFVGRCGALHPSMWTMRAMRLYLLAVRRAVNQKAAKRHRKMNNFRTYPLSGDRSSYRCPAGPLLETRYGNASNRLPVKSIAP